MCDNKYIGLVYLSSLKRDNRQRRWLTFKRCCLPTSPKLSFSLTWLQAQTSYRKLTGWTYCVWIAGTQSCVTQFITALNSFWKAPKRRWSEPGLAVQNCVLLITVKIPIKYNYEMREEEFNHVNELRNVFGKRRWASLVCVPVHWRVKVTSMFWAPFATRWKRLFWRDRTPVQPQEDKYISGTVGRPRSHVFIKKDYCGFGDPTDSRASWRSTYTDNVCENIECAKIPEKILSRASAILSRRYDGGVTGIKSSCIISMSLIFFDQQSEKKLNSPRNVTGFVQQTSGPLIKWVPSP